MSLENTIQSLGTSIINLVDRKVAEGGGGGSSRNIGEIVSSTIPLTDAGLHLLDGALIDGSGSYADFVTYIANLYEDTKETLYAWTGVPDRGPRQGETLTIYTKTLTIEENTVLYNIDGSVYNGHADNTTYEPYFTISTTPNKSYVSIFAGAQGTVWYGTSATRTASSDTEVATPCFCTETQWQISVTNYGACDKYVYDSINNTVRLPKRTTEHGELIKSYSLGTDWYRIYEDGWCEQGGEVYQNANADIVVNLSIAYKDTNYTIHRNSGYGTGGYNSTTYAIHDNNVWNLTTTSFTAKTYNAEGLNRFRWTARGYIDISNYQYSPIYEYIVVATSTKTDIQVDIDEIATDLNGKVDKADLQEVQCVVESYINQNEWYRVWSDGWCEQGGGFGAAYTSYTLKTVTFLKPFRDANYTFVCNSAAAGNVNDLTIYLKTSSDIQIRNTVNYGALANWYACGYINLEV